MTNILFTCYRMMHRRRLTKEAFYRTLRVTAPPLVKTHTDKQKNMNKTDFVDNSSGVHIFCLRHKALAVFGRGFCFENLLYKFKE
jgi:hypothetical protein